MWNRRTQRNSLLGDVPQGSCFQVKEQGIEGGRLRSSGGFGGGCSRAGETGSDQVENFQSGSGGETPAP